jgi:hypothetical protein
VRACIAKAQSAAARANPRAVRQRWLGAARAGLALARNPIVVGYGKIGKASKTRRAVPELVYSVCITPALETAKEIQIQQRKRHGADRAPASAGMSSYEQSVFVEI